MNRDEEFVALGLATEFLFIQVVRSDGQHEVLTLTEPVTLHKASEGGQASINTGTGMSHFFTEEGIYDGWSQPFSVAIPEGSDALQEVIPAIDAIEADRDVTDPSRGENDGKQ